MKKSLISVAILAALSSTQVSAGGPKFNMDGQFSVTCVEVEGDSGEPQDRRFYNAVMKQRGQGSVNFELKMVSLQEDATGCIEADELLTEEGISIDDDSDDSDDSDDEDVSADGTESIDDDESVDSVDDDESVDSDDDGSEPS